MKIQKLLSSFQVVTLSTFLTVSSLFCAPSLSLAQMSCERVFLPLFGHLRPDFQHDTHYTHEVSYQPEVLNQCNFGTCHLHSWASSLEHDYKTNHNGKEIKLSMHYLTAMLWLQRSFETLQKNDKSYQVDMGGMPSTSRDFILNVGLIPESAWQGSRTFEEGDISLRLQAYVQNIIAQAKLAIELAKSEEQKKAILEDAGKLIVSVFDNFGVHFPKSFTYEGQSYSPQSFALAFFPQLEKPVLNILPNLSPDAKTELRVNKDKTSYELATSKENAERWVMDELNKGHDVFLAYDHDATYVDMKTGVMSISAFEAPDYSQPLPLILRSNVFKMPFQGHAVQIVGYDLDPTTGRLKKWKIKNSWGDKVGDHGYFHMYADYAEAHVASYSFFLPDDAKLPTPKEEPTVTAANPK